MSRLRLYLDPLPAPVVHRFVRADGSVGAVPALRLIAFANMMPFLARGADAARFAVVKALVDTGAHMAIVSERLTRALRPGVVIPLPFAPGKPAADKTLSVAGGTYPFDLGEMWLHLEDQSGGRLDIRVVAKFTRGRRAAHVPADPRTPRGAVRRPAGRRRAGPGRPVRPAVGGGGAVSRPLRTSPRPARAGTIPPEWPRAGRRGDREYPSHRTASAKGRAEARILPGA